jgi:hypothetical protein
MENMELVVIAARLKVPIEALLPASRDALKLAVAAFGGVKEQCSGSGVVKLITVCSTHSIASRGEIRRGWRPPMRERLRDHFA